MSAPGGDIIEPDPENPNFDHDKLERDRLNKLLDAAKDLLRGHFSGLVIIGTTVTENGCTAMLSRVDGDWYAQNGAMRYMLRKREAGAQIEAEEQHNRDNL